MCFIFFSLQKESGNFQQQWQLLAQKSISWYVVGLVVALMPLNWLLEAMKWKIIASKIHKISLYTSLQSVLAGISLGFSTPHAIGDYLARIGYSSSPNRWGLTGGLLLSRLSQMFFTALLGLVGIAIFTFQIRESSLNWPIRESLYSILIILAIGAFAWWGRNRLYHFVKKRKFQIQRFLVALSRIDNGDLLKIFTLSLTRNMVFSAQFVILLYFFFPDASLVILLGGVWWIFLFKSILPSFSFLSDLGIRELSALLYFQTIGFDSAPVIAASLAIWMVNILFPAILGLPFLWNIRLQTSKPN